MKRQSFTKSATEVITFIDEIFSRDQYGILKVRLRALTESLERNPAQFKGLICTTGLKKKKKKKVFQGTTSKYSPRHSH
jgi:hypothetical protein